MEICVATKTTSQKQPIKICVATTTMDYAPPATYTGGLQAQAQAQPNIIDRVVNALLMASKANNWSNTVTTRALQGLAGYVCGNNDIESAMAVIEKLPKKEQKKIAQKIEIALGYFDHIEMKNGKQIVYKHNTPLFSIDKTGCVTCNWEALTGNRKDRTPAYSALCGNRKKLDPNYTVKALPINDKANTHLESLKNLVQKIARDKNNWLNDSNAVKLAQIIEQISETFIGFDIECLSDQDLNAMRSTANKHGRAID